MLLITYGVALATTTYSFIFNRQILLGSFSRICKLHQLLKFFNNRINLCLCVMLAEREAYRNQPRVIMQGLNNVAALVGAAGTGAAAAGTNTIHIKAKQQHFALISFGEIYAKYRV